MKSSVYCPENLASQRKGIPCTTAHILSKGFTLVETLAATLIIAIAVTGAAALSTTMNLQEEMSWRTTVGLNLQENAARLWQLGLTPNDIRSILPNTSGNVQLAEILEADSRGNVIYFPAANDNGLATENPTPSYPTPRTDAPYSNYPSVGTLAYLENCLGLTVKIKSLGTEASSVRSVTLYRPKARAQRQWPLNN
jgi:prepilin-type N-terminal cleavage/methylation domain-containing protein